MLVSKSCDGEYSSNFPAQPEVTSSSPLRFPSALRLYSYRHVLGISADFFNTAREIYTNSSPHRFLTAGPGRRGHRSIYNVHRLDEQKHTEPQAPKLGLLESTPRASATGRKQFLFCGV